MKSKPVHTTQRVEFLSDGVFAIALTLLTIDVVAATKVSEPGTTLVDHLIHEWQAIIAYPIGFTTLLVIWVNHHRIFQFVDRVDTGLLWINGLILLLVAGTPIPTALLAEHVPGPEETLPVALYLSTFVLLPALFWLLWVYAEKRALLSPDYDPAGFRGMKWIYLFVAVFDSVALLLGYFASWVSLILLLVSFAAIASPGWASRQAARVLARWTGSSGLDAAASETAAE
ncbi:MAG: TMEM175 family protein [Bauldia sp.]